MAPEVREEWERTSGVLSALTESTAFCGLILGIVSHVHSSKLRVAHLKCVHFIVCELYSNSSLKNANFKNHFYSVCASPRAYTCHAAKDPEGQTPKG